MRFAAFFIFSFIFSGAICAEPITFGFLREGVGYEALDKPQLLNLLPSDTLFITTESGNEFPIEITRFSRSFHGNLLISGSTFSDDAFVMVVNPLGEIYGALRDGSDFYRLQSESDQAQMMLSDPGTSFAPYDEDVAESEAMPEIDPASLELSATDSRSQASFENTVRPVYRSGKAVIDLLLYYDTKLENHEMVLDHIVEVGNEVLQRTLTGTELRVVGTRGGDVPSDWTNGDILDFLSQDSEIANDRQFYKADLVHAVRAKLPNSAEDGTCGVAFSTVHSMLGRGENENSVGVTEWNPPPGMNGYSCADETFIHEIGHNLGSMHERAQYPPFGDRGPLAAYPYSYGKREVGVFRTIMSYGTEGYVGIFSAPEGTCGGYSCGEITEAIDSADNRRSVRNTRHLVAGYEGQGFRYESIQEFAYEQDCSDGSDRSRGIVLNNSHNTPIHIRGLVALRADGTEYNVWSFEPGDRVAAPKGKSGALVCGDLFGTDVREAYFVYENPVTGALVEGRHVLFDQSYSGGYSFIKVSSSSNGRVDGHPALTVRSGESTTITFTANSGFELSGISGTCVGSVRGNTYTVQNAYGDCTVIPTFKAVASSDDVFRVSLEEPVPGNTYTGIRNLRGWALASSGIETLEVFIDGVYQYDIPYGGFRSDVANIFPEVDDSAKSGFSMALGYTNLSVGEHVAMVRATTAGGSVKESSSTFSVAKFHKPFIGASDTVSLSGGSCQLSGDTMSVTGASIDGQSYDLDLQWRTAAQDFEIIEIGGDNNSGGFSDMEVASSLAKPIAASDDVFRVSLEEPVPGNTYTGIRNLRGWALASSGIEKVEVFIDGVYQFDIPHGGFRLDVGNVFPEVEGSSNSGFSMAYGYTNLSAGEHVATVRVTSSDGGVEESSGTFTVAKFHKPFIGPSDTVNLSGGSCDVSGDTISVGGALIDGQRYDLDLQWRTAAQDFEIIRIN